MKLKEIASAASVRIEKASSAQDAIKADLSKLLGVDLTTAPQDPQALVASKNIIRGTLNKLINQGKIWWSDPDDASDGRPGESAFQRGDVDNPKKLMYSVRLHDDKKTLQIY